ncbi:pre-mRNA-splicing factor SPF27 isoform X2 [Lepidochelys kempii]|uniref:pre-mRNA-splicing factor SPF27 isoform X2 n=1 Tax=Lepidochelys kempii TaxID=8472 RepID=UPI003C6EF888
MRYPTSTRAMRRRAYGRRLRPWWRRRRDATGPLRITSATCPRLTTVPLRYELPAPSSGQKNDITAWQECVNNSMAQLEHQAVRIENLELMSQHGCNAWKVYNEHLVHMIEQAQKELQKLRKNIQDLNWQRKNMQLTAGSKLREMESTWVSLVSKNYEIERTIVQLENEILQIKQQHGEANKENIEQEF